MNEEISLTPVGRSQIHKLEYALLVGTLFRPEVMEALKNPAERLTWLDALAVAAAAVARSKAKIPVSQIAEELGRTEATIRNHISGKSKAGELVLKTYESFLREGVKIEIPTEAEEKVEKAKKALVEAAEKLVEVAENLKQKASQI